MLIAINDANIIFDLIDLGIFNLLFNLDMKFITSDFVANEIKIEKQKIVFPKYIKNGQEVASFHYEEMVKINELQTQNSGISFNDSSVLYLAIREKAILLTGDKKLRETANKYKVESHGIIWILDKMVEFQILTNKKALEYLRQLMESNTRMPKSECNKFLQKWSEFNGNR